MDTTRQRLSSGQGKIKKKKKQFSQLLFSSLMYLKLCGYVSVYMCVISEGEGPQDGG